MRTKAEIETEIRKRDADLKQVEEICKKEKRLRWWSIPHDQRLLLAARRAELAALPAEQIRPSLTEMLVEEVRSLEATTKNLFWSELQAPEKVEPPRDIYTGEILQLPTNLSERGAFSKRWPRWFQILVERERAANNQAGGKSAAQQAIDFENAVKAYEAEQSFRKNYDHSQNPWVTNDRDGMNAAVQVHGEEWAKRMEAEAAQPSALQFTSGSAELNRNTRERALRYANLEKELEEVDLERVLEHARQTGRIIDRARGETGDRRPDERRPMKLPAWGSKEQTERQHEAARKAAETVSATR
jgi:hypothetical protein